MGERLKWEENYRRDRRWENNRIRWEKEAEKQREGTGYLHWLFIIPGESIQFIQQIVELQSNSLNNPNYLYIFPPKDLTNKNFPSTQFYNSSPLLLRIRDRASNILINPWIMKWDLSSIFQHATILSKCSCNARVHINTLTISSSYK